MKASSPCMGCLLAGRANGPWSRVITGVRSISTAVHFYQNRQLELYASKEAQRLTLRQLVCWNVRWNCDYAMIMLCIGVLWTLHEWGTSHQSGSYFTFASSRIDFVTNGRVLIMCGQNYPSVSLIGCVICSLCHTWSWIKKALQKCTRCANNPIHRPYETAEIFQIRCTGPHSIGMLDDGITMNVS